MLPSKAERRRGNRATKQLAPLRARRGTSAPEAIVDTPPFEPDFVSESDRRRFQRIKCYVAVEIHIEGQETPVWAI